MEIVVKPVESRRERKQFLNLPWQLYRGDANWIPPLRQNQKGLVGYARHPFHEQAQTQTFLALADGEPCGRVSAILNEVHNNFHQERLGFWGFFESIDNQEVASKLFDAVRQWLAARDIHHIRGPVNPSLNYECGLLIDGFQYPPTFMMTYNKPYYPRLVEAYGFRKAHDLFAFWGPTEMVHRLDKKLSFVATEAAERFDIKVRPIDKSRFKQEIQMFLDLYNQSLGATWGFVPLSKHEIEHMSAEMKHLILPDLAMFATVGGRPIGAVFGIPDYNPRIKEIDGRLFPFGVFKLLSKRRPFKRFRVISANVIPEYQKWGVGLVLMKALVPNFLRTGLKEAEFSWVLESNQLSRRTLEKGGAMLEKTYRIYDYPPPAADATPAAH
jgi:GNAT superfamily N-acetyltransferase